MADIGTTLEARPRSGRRPVWRGKRGGGDDDDDEELTLEEYFERVQEISTDFTGEINANEDAFADVVDDEDADEDDRFDAFKELFRKNVDAANDWLVEAHGLSPPEEVADLHDDFIEELRTFVDTLENIADELDDVESFEEVASVFQANVELDAGAFERTCLALEQAAADNGFTLDLDCNP